MDSFPSTTQQALPPPVVASDGQQRIVQRVLAAKTPWRQAGDDESSRVRMIKNEVVAAFGEFIGTTWFLFFAFGGTNVALNSLDVNDTSINPTALLYSSLAFGFGLTVTVWVFFRVTGGLFNPAIAFGLGLVGIISKTRALIAAIASLLGGIAAAALISVLLPGPLRVATRLGQGTSISQGLFLEAFLTFSLMMTVFMCAAEKHRATFLAPVSIGLALFIAELVGDPYTGGSLNPARSFGPDVVDGSFPGYHWIYWVGPLLGSSFAAGFYLLLKFVDYQQVTPNQDSPGDSLPVLAVAISEDGDGPPKVMDQKMVEDLVRRQSKAMSGVSTLHDRRDSNHATGNEGMSRHKSG